MPVTPTVIVGPERRTERGRQGRLKRRQRAGTQEAVSAAGLSLYVDLTHYGLIAGFRLSCLCVDSNRKFKSG